MQPKFYEPFFLLVNDFCLEIGVACFNVDQFIGLRLSFIVM